MRPITEVMTRKPVSIPVDASVGDALSLARARQVDHLLVTVGGRFAGVVCAQCDLANALPGANLRDSMHAPLQTIDSDASIEDAADVMCREGVCSLLVVDGEDAVGIATRGDLVRGGYECDDALESRFFCAACGQYSHVTTDPNTDLVAFCESCWDRAQPPRFWEDIGGYD